MSIVEEDATAPCICHVVHFPATGYRLHLQSPITGLQPVLATDIALIHVINMNQSSCVFAVAKPCIINIGLIV